MAKLRSPNYPSMSLSDAVARTKLIYEKEFTNSASREVMIKAMGYSGINGASAVAFSALTKYGLISSVGSDQYKISDDGLNIILYARGEASRTDAIAKAAFAPQLFAELREQYPNALPSDENLTAFLVKRGFNPRSIADLIRNYRDTVEFLSTETSPPLGQTVPLVPPADVSEQSPKEREQNEKAENIERSDLTFKISRDSDVRILFSGPVTLEAIEKLISLLNLSKDVYPSQSELDSENS